MTPPRRTAPICTVPPPRVRRRIRTIVARLQRIYGRQRWRTWGRPLDVLVGTILSQNTTDRNSDLAMARLRLAFPDWNALAQAPIWKIAGAIRPAGLHRQKAARIRAIIGRLIRQRGRADLDFLRHMDTQQVAHYLRSMPGVGPKTAACVLLFSLRRPVLPVDTHVHRVSVRLGLVPRGATAERAHELLGPVVPANLTYPFHVLLIRHGRSVCRARRPDHGRCVLADLCPSI